MATKAQILAKSAIRYTIYDIRYFLPYPFSLLSSAPLQLSRHGEGRCRSGARILYKSALFYAKQSQTKPICVFRRGERRVRKALVVNGQGSMPKSIENP